MMKKRRRAEYYLGEKPFPCTLLEPPPEVSVSGLGIPQAVAAVSCFLCGYRHKKNVLGRNEKLDLMLHFFRPVLPSPVPGEGLTIGSGDIQRPRCICLPLPPELPCRAEFFHWEPPLLLCPEGFSPPGEPAFRGPPQSLHLLINHALFLKGSQDSHNNYVEISSPVRKAGTLWRTLSGSSFFPKW